MSKNLKLGCLPPRTVKGQPHLYTVGDTRRAPTHCDRSSVAFAPLLGHNDVYGDCTAIGLQNSAIGFMALNGSGLVSSDQDAVTFYQQSTGFDPNDPATDRGGVEVDVLSFAAAHGIQLGYNKLFPLWGSVGIQSQNDLALACSDLGAIYLGVALAEADELSIGSVWDTSTCGCQTPGSWGYHCLLLWDYEGLEADAQLTLITWGKQQKATWRWLLSRITEAHAVIWPQLASPIRGTFTTENLANLRRANLRFLVENADRYST